MLDQDFQQVRQLIEASLRNPNAYASVVKYYELRLRRYVRRLLGHHAALVEDVLQETFIKAYLNLNDYDLTRSFAPWIFRIAHNEAITALRKRNLDPATVDLESAALILERMTDGRDGLSALEAKDTAKIVQSAMATLDRRYRDVLVLRFLEEHSYDQISEILEIPPGTVATHINRGLKQLQTYLITSGQA